VVAMIVRDGAACKVRDPRRMRLGDPFAALARIVVGKISQPVEVDHRGDKLMTLRLPTWFFTALRSRSKVTTP